MATTSAPDKGFDPEAEQEVDFARYGRMLARRWWLVAIGVVAGAVIGFVVSLGGTKLYSATSTIYLGQPYNQSGVTPVQAPQTNPAAAGAVANAQKTVDDVAKKCKTTPETFRKGISVQRVATASSATKSTAQINPLVTVTVQASKGKVAACAATGLARAAVGQLGAYPRAKVVRYTSQIAYDKSEIKRLAAAIQDPTISTTDTLVLETTLRNDQQDLQTYSGLLLQATFVELPKVMVVAAAHQVSAQSSRNTVLISALIGLILGIIAALLWDRIVPRNGS